MVVIKKIFISIIYYFVPCKILVKITSFNLSSDMYYSKCVRYLEIIKIIIKKKTKMLSILKVTQSLKKKKSIQRQLYCMTTTISSIRTCLYNFTNLPKRSYNLKVNHSAYKKRF